MSRVFNNFDRNLGGMIYLNPSSQTTKAPKYGVSSHFIFQIGVFPVAAAQYPTLQDFFWTASLVAVKASEGFQRFEEFQNYTFDNLPQNSPETRRRYTELIQRRYFPERSMTGLVPTVWRSYHDEQLLSEVMRVTALEGEPTIAHFVLTHILPKAPGSTVDPEQVRTFIKETYGEFKEKSYQRLLQTCRDLGFLGRYNGDHLIEQLNPSANALLILLHDRLASTPRIVRLSELLQTNWWRLLGLREADEVRRLLRQAEMAGLLSRFTKVDELEQITTRYSRDEYFSRAVRLP